MSDASIKARRAELLAEAFLDDLKPSRFVKAESQQLAFDFVVAFKKPNNELKYYAVEVKHTEKPPRENFHFMTGRHFVEDRRSNMPTVVLVADTKHNELYYGFASEAKVINPARKTGFYEVAVPTKKTGFSVAEKNQFIADVLKN